MEYRKLPHGTEKISTLGLGMGGIQNCPPNEIQMVIERAIENSINFFDLCAGGKSVYEPFGKAIKGKREKIYFQPESLPEGLYKAHRPKQHQRPFFLRLQPCICVYRKMPLKHKAAYRYPHNTH